MRNRRAGKRQRRNRIMSNLSSTRGYESRAVAHLNGRTAAYCVGGDGSTTAALSLVGSATTTFSIIVLDPVSLGLRVSNVANSFSEWKLRSITVEYVQRQSVTACFAVGYTDDGGASVTTPTFSEIAELEASRVFNTGSGLKQSFTVRPRTGWLKTSNYGASTIPSFRQVAAGSLWGIWDAAPALANYGSLFIHYDLQFRSPVTSIVVNLAEKEKESVSKEKTFDTGAIRGPNTELDEKSSGGQYRAPQTIPGDLGPPAAGLRLCRQQVQSVAAVGVTPRLALSRP